LEAEYIFFGDTVEQFQTALIGVFTLIPLNILLIVLYFVLGRN
jgi:hypothetical protein